MPSKGKRDRQRRTQGLKRNSPVPAPDALLCTRPSGEAHQLLPPPPAPVRLPTGPAFSPLPGAGLSACSALQDAASEASDWVGAS